MRILYQSLASETDQHELLCGQRPFSREDCLVELGGSQLLALVAEDLLDLALHVLQADQHVLAVGRILFGRKHDQDAIRVAEVGAERERGFNILERLGTSYLCLQFK